MEEQSTSVNLKTIWGVKIKIEQTKSLGGKISIVNNYIYLHNKGRYSPTHQTYRPTYLE